MVPELVEVVEMAGSMERSALLMLPVTTEATVEGAVPAPTTRLPALFNGSRAAVL